MFRWLVEQTYATHVRVRLEVCGKTDFFVKQPIAELDTALAVGDVVPIGWLVEQRHLCDPRGAEQSAPGRRHSQTTLRSTLCVISSSAPWRWSCWLVDQRQAYATHNDCDRPAGL